MKLINIEVRKAFSMIYFDQDYIRDMHSDFINQFNNYTQLYEENQKGEIIPLDRSDKFYENRKLFFYDEKEKEKEKNLKSKEKLKKIYIPELPYNKNWIKYKEVFKKGIENSIYFIN